MNSPHSDKLCKDLLKKVLSKDDMPKLESGYCIWCCREITNEPKQKHKNCEDRPSGALPISQDDYEQYLYDLPKKDLPPRAGPSGTREIVKALSNVSNDFNWKKAVKLHNLNDITEYLRVLLEAGRMGETNTVAMMAHFGYQNDKDNKAYLNFSFEDLTHNIPDTEAGRDLLEDTIQDTIQLTDDTWPPYWYPIWFLNENPTQYAEDYYY